MKVSASTWLVCLVLLAAPSALMLSASGQPGQVRSAIEPPDTIAHNVWIQPELRDEVMAAYAASPTFRELCHFIDRTMKLNIGIVIDKKMAADRVCRAQCVMRVYESGLITARIVLPGPIDITELVAHELEHVRERVEGINLAERFARRTPGVFRLKDGRFETQRAADLGRRVKAEVERATPASILTTRRVTP